MTSMFLPASEVAPGHCVIINDCDCPEGNLVAVVTSVTPERCTARYLAKAVSMKECYGPPENVTPVGWFGVAVLHGHGLFVCMPDETIPKTAKYKDGKPRHWQERPRPMQHAAKQDVLVIARSQIKP